MEEERGAGLHNRGHLQPTQPVSFEFAAFTRPPSWLLKPLHRSLGLAASTRASLYLYNDEADISKLVESLKEALEMLK